MPSGMRRSCGRTAGPSAGTRPSGASRTQPGGQARSRQPSPRAEPEAEPVGDRAEVGCRRAVERHRAQDATRRPLRLVHEPRRRRRRGRRPPVRRSRRAMSRVAGPRRPPRRSGREAAAGAVGHDAVAGEADQDAEIGRLEVTGQRAVAGSTIRVRQATSPQDWIASRSPSAAHVNSVEKVRPKRASAGERVEDPPGRAAPSSGRRQTPRSARLARSTRIS